MGDPESNKATSFLLPPGCRFHPSDEQLVCYYLTSKNITPLTENDTTLNGYDLIKELDLYNYDPFELPDCACFPFGYGGRRRHWYCYVVRVLKESRERRTAKGGCWRRRGRVRDVLGRGGKVVVGTRTKFVFYLGNSAKSAVRTDWVMYEYALAGDFKASFVLSRVFIKSQGGNSISDNIISSCAEESVSTVRHVGVQWDGFLTPDIVEAKMHDGNSVGRNDGISIFPRGPIHELDAKLQIGPLCNSQVPNKLVTKLGLAAGSTFIEPVANEHLLSVLEEDFIELDDIVD